MKIIETRPREIGFVSWGHCQNLLDDPRTFNFLQFCGELPIFMYKFSLVNFKTRICALYILCGAFYITVTT